MEETTHIRIFTNTKLILDSLKIHPNQSYDEVIQSLIMNKKGEKDGRM